MFRLAATLDAVKATRSRNEKTKHLADLLQRLDEAELVAACRLIVAAPLAVDDHRTLGVGWALLLEAVASVSGATERALLASVRTHGDFGEGVAPLWPNDRPGLSLRDVVPAIEALAAAETRAEKLSALVRTLAQAHAAEAKYLVKALSGEVRIGVLRGTLDDALARAFELDPALVRRASALTPDVGTLALRAKRRELETASIELGHVVAFMLATPSEAVKEPIDPASVVVEDKLDGVRAQAHVRGGDVRLFARGTGDVTRSFPDVVTALAHLPDVVLDGEIIAVTAEGGPRPFQALQARLGRSAPEASAQRETPVRFIAFDLLYERGPLLAAPWRERRGRLEALKLFVNPVTTLSPELPVAEQLDALFEAARSRGHEGLMVKRTDATYDAGKRGSAWRKVKKALATLDVVITRAEYGHGKRVGVLSDYTFGVWRGDVLVEIGKAYSGLTDAEIAELTERLLALSTGPIGHQLAIPPAIVLEVAFDGLQPSGRHDGGFALRFPRIARLRPDKAPRDADTLETVKRLFDAQVTSGHRERSAQLGLFE